MREITAPQVYLIAKTELVKQNLAAYLKDIGGPRWEPDPAAPAGETLIEAAGRLCYRSWQAFDPDIPEGTNPNIERVRGDSRAYLKNILAHEHGSVLEHVSVTFIIRDVSRVCTHELVRHRAGMAYSQESLRYVRLDNLAFWFPEAVKKNPEALSKFREVVGFLEGVQKDLARLFDIENMKEFAAKKKLTSLFRRLAPIGLGTTIMVTGNLRAFRHVIAMRTHEGAEEEIRLVIKEIARILKEEYPAVFQDMRENPTTGAFEFDHSKV
ncbi:MAG TPA: FAD-dependent thymidylate synthase [Spirochaetia bacterium]|nr:FAD-dependent thymidylate synthase [Spirochaetia bacterium]